MLEIINLYVLNKIFDNAEDKLSPLAKMLYINCLTHWFKGKKATTTNSYAFELLKEDIPNYEAYQKLFTELQLAGLVGISFGGVFFHNFWGAYINKALLDKADEKGDYGFLQGISVHAEDLRRSVGIKEVCCMKNRINAKQVEFLIEIFIKEQTTIEKKYTGYSDCAKHFINWLPNNISKAPADAIKSNSKLLGE
jgi:hypothetical protein